MTSSLLLFHWRSRSRAAAPNPSTPSYRVYVTNEGSGDITVIDPVKMEALMTVPLGKRARGIHATPDGKQILVALSGSPFAPPGVDESTLPPADKSADGIGVFDVATSKMLRKVPGGSDPEQFAISKDGKLLYVSNEDIAGVSLVDPVNGQVLTTLKTGEEPEGVTMSPDGKFVFVTSEEDGNIAVVDTAAAKVVHTIKVGRRPRSVVFLPDGSRAFVSNENDATVSVIDVAKMQEVQVIPTGEGTKPMGLAITGDGKRVFVSTGRGKTVVVLDTAAGKVDGAFRSGRPALGHRAFARRKTAVHRERAVQRRFRGGRGDAHGAEKNQGRRQAVGRHYASTVDYEHIRASNTLCRWGWDSGPRRHY